MTTETRAALKNAFALGRFQTLYNALPSAGQRVVDTALLQGGLLPSTPRYVSAALSGPGSASDSTQMIRFRVNEAGQLVTQLSRFGAPPNPDGVWHRCSITRDVAVALVDLFENPRQETPPCRDPN